MAKICEPLEKIFLKNLDSNPQSDKWRKLTIIFTLSMSNQPTKICPRARWVIVCELLEEPRVGSKKLKASIMLASVNVHESKIRRALNNNDVRDKAAGRKPLLFKNNTAGPYSLLKITWPTRGLSKKMWMGRKNFFCIIVLRKKNTAFKHKNIILSIKLNW